MKLSSQQGEFGYNLELTVRDHDGGIHTLSGTETVQAYVTKEGSDPAAFGSSVVDDGVLGLVLVTVGSDDVTTLVQGTYEIRLKISGVSSVLIPEPATLEIGRGVS